jgi:hypothetical protein
VGIRGKVSDKQEKKMSHFFTTDKKLRVIHPVIILMLLFMMFAMPRPASACSCVMPGSPSMEFSQSDAVFSGRVTGIVNKLNPAVALLQRIGIALGFDPFIFYTDRFWGNAVMFEVTNSWKLVDTTSIQVSTGSGGGDCGYGFSVGNDYLVYAYDDPGEPGIDLGTGICSRTTDLPGAAEDMSFLKTMPTIPLTQAPPPWGQIVIITIAVVFLVSAVLVLFVWRRKKRNSD